MNYLPTCTSGLVVQHLCQVSFKSMQGCRRSWEDKLKCVKILSVKDHNSAKIFWTWIISPHALLDLWCNIPAKFHSNPCKYVGRSWEDKLKCVTILGVKDHNSAKICRTWIISPHALRAPDNFWVQCVFTPQFLTQCGFQNFKWYFHPLYFSAMLKREGMAVLKRVSAVLCRFKYSLSSNLLLLVIFKLQTLFCNNTYHYAKETIENICW